MNEEMNGKINGLEKKRNGYRMRLLLGLCAIKYKYKLTFWESRKILAGRRM